MPSTSRVMWETRGIFAFDLGFDLIDDLLGMAHGDLYRGARRGVAAHPLLIAACDRNLCQNIATSLDKLLLQTWHQRLLRSSISATRKE